MKSVTGWINIEDGLPDKYSIVWVIIQTMYDRWIEISGFETICFHLPARGRTTHVCKWQYYHEGDAMPEMEYSLSQSLSPLTS